ncbi:hypothetical protein PCANC_13869 [Puccinia coronata f. sp. avenae]|uniref:Uncharacterized protein n=1 Tax=Puccinia coronata f. sp. avenae TaxID=200324 RepID=A0A2N5UT27_9BASI|nr:hypothetical protein PCANC_13869 [Puccinia coronata f. sp. avenae]
MHNILVVEWAVQPSPANATSNALLPTIQRPIGVRGKYIDLTVEDTGTSISDSDIEIVKSTLATSKVIDTCRPPQQTKQAFDELDSTADKAPKKHQTTVTQAKSPPKRPLSVTSATQKSPLASGSRVSQQTLHTTTQSPSTPQSNPTSNPGSQNSPQELYHLKLNTLPLSLVTLGQIVEALQLVKGRNEMAKRATLAKLVDFVCDSHLLMRMLQGSPLGLKSSPLPEVEWASQPNNPEEEGEESQKLAMVKEGRDFSVLWHLGHGGGGMPKFG